MPTRCQLCVRRGHAKIHEFSDRLPAAKGVDVAHTAMSCASPALAACAATRVRTRGEGAARWKFPPSRSGVAPRAAQSATANHLVALSFWDKPPRRASAAWELFRSFSCSGAPFGRGRIPRRRRGRDTRTDEPEGVPRGRRQPPRVRQRRVLRGRVGVRRGTSCS